MRSLRLRLLVCLLLWGSSLAQAQEAAPRPDLRPEALNTNPNNWQQVAPGLEHLRLWRGAYKPDDPKSGPWLINILRVDPTRLRLEVRHAMDEGIGLETVSDLAKRCGAIAAINGGFFAISGTYRGDPVGALMVKGALLSEPWRDRTSVAWWDKGNTTELFFSPLRWDNSLRVTSLSPNTPRPVREPLAVTLDGINRPRGANELILYTPDFHRTTLTDNNGIEVVVRAKEGPGKVEQIYPASGSQTIPRDGYVLSASGTRAAWVELMLRPKAKVELKSACRPTEGGNEALWRQAQDIVTGSPRIVRDGLPALNLAPEHISQEFSETWHPRTAIGRSGDGKILLVTVDGRQPQLSAGMPLEMLARLLLEYGAKDALNLDGGGSTTMYVKDRVVNSPSDKTGERPVSDAILLFPRVSQ